VLALAFFFALRSGRRFAVGRGFAVGYRSGVGQWGDQGASGSQMGCRPPLPPRRPLFFMVRFLYAQSLKKAVYTTCFLSLSEYTIPMSHLRPCIYCTQRAVPT